MRVGKFPDLGGFFRGAAWQAKSATTSKPWILRVLATVDNHVVWRFKGCGVNVTGYKEFLDRFERAPGFDRKM